MIMSDGVTEGVKHLCLLQTRRSQMRTALSKHLRIDLIVKPSTVYPDLFPKNNVLVPKDKHQCVFHSIKKELI